MATEHPIRLLIADDPPLIRRGGRGMIGTDRVMTVLAEARNGEEAVALYRRHRPDVAPGSRDASARRPR
jgi:YesN/AraC family two-component response regulator